MVLPDLRGSVSKFLIFSTWVEVFKYHITNLQNKIIHMNVLKEASMPDSPEPLKDDDKEDCDKALTNLSKGIKSLQCDTFFCFKFL